ncbi:hypothetical protein BGZ51_005164 [Haplosporangium sp. Z 767]|nr:hypothetical protein BGZ51_005164 [Haplosporangium sp. Z 767]KAF9183457.1 hypothetical protein BGZ50_004219 [Haplosporangium sp. Z 11]
MGNVSSADHDRVNELLTRRAKRKLSDKKQQQLLLQQQQQQRQQQNRISGSADEVHLIISDIQDKSYKFGSNSFNSFDYTNAGTASPAMQRQKSSSRYQQHPLDQADFYSSTSNSRVPDGLPQSPASPSFSIPSSATTPTSTSYQSDTPYFNSRFDDRLVDTAPGSSSPVSPRQQSQFPPPRTQYSATPTSTHQYHSSPIVILDQHRHGHASTSSADDIQYAKSPVSPTYVPSRRGSEHHLQYLQQQQQLSADAHFLGTSPEAKDWLKQKPTRSSTHLIHQYNFQNHQYYQQPGSISVKVVNNTCRNMSDYANVPSLSSLGSASGTRNYASRSTTAISSISNNANGGRQTYVSAPIPTSRSRGLSQPEPPAMRSVDNNKEDLPAVPSFPQEPRVGKLVMSRSKLISPLRPSKPSSESPPLGSPLQSRSPTTQSFSAGETDSANTSTGPRQYRPSSTLSSLRSLLGNHPQGLSLIESLEDDDYDDTESISDTETGDSETDIIQRTASLTMADVPSDATTATESNEQEKRSSRRRPPPQLEWMADRRRFSASSLSTISRDIHDSQKGQHALWKYIGGGNSHAPLPYDIDRILDSGCGLGEWTMEMAKEYPNATVYGIDINPDLFPGARQAMPSNCLFTQSNLLTRLSFPDQYFDFVYQRFLYLGLTVDDWPIALKELRRVMKPGGWIELFEPCMRVHRAGPRTREVMRWCSRLLQEERGLDFDFAGPKMKRLCESEEIGFKNVKLERLSIPVGPWGGRVGQAMAENMVLIFQSLQSALIPEEIQTSGGPPQKIFDGMIQSWIRECEENKSYIDYYILTGQRP